MSMGTRLEITTTEENLAKAILWRSTVEDLNKGTYPGTEIPLRVVPSGAIVTLVVLDNGTSVVRDQVGGWVTSPGTPAVTGPLQHEENSRSQSQLPRRLS